MRSRRPACRDWKSRMHLDRRLGRWRSMCRIHLISGLHSNHPRHWIRPTCLIRLTCWRSCHSPTCRTSVHPVRKIDSVHPRRTRRTARNRPLRRSPRRHLGHRTHRIGQCHLNQTQTHHPIHPAHRTRLAPRLHRTRPIDRNHWSHQGHQNYPTVPHRQHLGNLRLHPSQRRCRSRRSERLVPAVRPVCLCPMPAPTRIRACPASPGLHGRAYQNFRRSRGLKSRHATRHCHRERRCWCPSLPMRRRPGTKAFLHTCS